MRLWPVFWEATGSWGNSIEAEESLCDHNNVSMTAPEFYYDFDCLEDDCILLHVDKEFSEDIFQVSKSQLPPRSLRWRMDVK